MIRTTVKISGMMCGMCEAHINDAIRSSFAVKKVSSSRSKGESVILSETPIDREAVGYILSPVSKNNISGTSQPVGHERVQSRTVVFQSP